MFGKREEPTSDEIHEQRQPSNVEVNAHQKSVSNRGLTGASSLTVRQSIVPITLVTVLFFMWGFAYGLLDVLNAKFQTALDITAAKAGGEYPFPCHDVLLRSPTLTIINAQVSKVHTSVPT